MDASLPEEILLDENAEAAAHAFYMVGGFEVSPDHALLAYAVDTKGGESYTLHVRELATGKQLLKTPIEVCGVRGVGAGWGCGVHGVRGGCGWVPPGRRTFFAGLGSAARPAAATRPAQACTLPRAARSR